MREKKTDEQLLEDARFYNKHAEYLLAMIQNRSLYERLGINEAQEVQDLTKNKLKKYYHKKALIWHPDSIKKTHKFCFASEPAYQTLVSQSFQMIEEAYRSLL